MELAGKVTVVTGSSRGLGRAMAETLAEAGARVVVNCSSSAADAEEVAAGINREAGEVRAMAFRADVSVKAEVEALFEAALERWGQVDVLINNAGLNIDGPFLTMTEEAWQRVLDVNLKGAFLCSQAAAPIMLRQGEGCIVNIGAATGIRGRKGGANFCAAKAGVIVLTRCLALELAPSIRVNCLIPGFSETQEVLTRYGLHDPTVRQRLVQEIPLGRLARPRDIAQVARFLVGPSSAYITGQLIFVNGGHFMH